MRRIPRQRPLMLGVAAAALASLVACGSASAPVPSPPEPRRAAPASPSSQTGYKAYVAVANADQVLVLTGAPWRVSNRITVPAPHDLAASPDGRYVAISGQQTGKITILRTADDQVLATPTVSSFTHTVGFTPDSRDVWVAAGPRGLAEVSVPDGRVVRTLPVPLPRAFHVAVSPRGGEQLWTNTGQSPGLLAVSTGPAASPTMVSTAATTPDDPYYSPDGGQLWSNFFGQPYLDVFSPVAPTQSPARLTIGPGAPFHLAFDGPALWATSGQGLLYQIDPNARRIIGQSRIGDAVPPGAYAAEGGPGEGYLGPAPAGEDILVVAASGTVTVVGRDGSVRRNIPVGSPLHDIVAVPAGPRR